MGIIIHEAAGIIHLCNSSISYLLKLLPDGHLGQLYFGSALRDREDFSHLFELAHRDMAPCPFEGNTEYSLEHIRQEYPAFGTGDMRYPAYEIEHGNGSRISSFLYQNYRIIPGKPKIPGLPAVYTESDDEAITLEIDLEDMVLGGKLTLRYTIMEQLPVIIRSTLFTCTSAQGWKLNRAMSINLDLPDSRYIMLNLSGASLRERYLDAHPIHHGVQSIHSMRGHSSHQFNPFFALKRENTDEHFGEVIGISLVYSGNFLAQAEADTMGTLRVMAGIHPEGFCWPLKKGETFQTPEAVMVYSRNGLNAMSQVYHQLYRTRLARGFWRDRPRPILINNWEATYMDFDEEKILSIAQKAKELGIELFVLDDGWFGERDDDTSSLGDWTPNRKKLPGGIPQIAQKITDLGMKFGLWFEPEMVSKKSRLFEEHPEWVLGSTDRPICFGRHQYVLDFSREEVVRYIGDQIEEILNNSPISYIKWDMNRSISDLFSAGSPAEYQGTIYHRQILGVYKLYDRLTRHFPKVLFESCASGGGRFDPGLLYYAPQGWLSDNTDAADRIKIQYGSSYVYPISSMGTHVSAVPNHQTFRTTPLSTRAAAAYFGTFGYELDLNQLTPDEQKEVKQQITFAKTHREFLQQGLFYRLQSPFTESSTANHIPNEAAWMVVSPDRQKALVAIFRFMQPVNRGYARLYLSGLCPQTEYTISDRAYSCYGDELMNAGLILSDYASGVRTSPAAQGDFTSRLIWIKAKK